MSSFPIVPLTEVVDIHDYRREPVSQTEHNKREGPFPYFGANGQVGWIIEKQRQIAAHLKAQLAEVDKARQAAEAQLRDADVLGQRIFNKIWAELDSVPRKPLGEYAQTTSGSTPARGNEQYWQPAEIAWVKTAEVAFAPITKTEEAISQKALAECSLTLLPPKTVLIAMYGQGKTRGQSAILEIPATTNQACFAILPNDAWEPEFLFLWLKFSYQDLRTLPEGRCGNQANLNGELLKAFQIPMPDKPTQKAIIAKIENALTGIEAVKNGSKAMPNNINLLPQKILARQASQGWGAKVIDRLAHDLRNAFPNMKGFSRPNLMFMRAFAEAWPDEQIVQQAVGQLPWGHNLVLPTRLKEPEQKQGGGRICARRQGPTHGHRGIQTAGRAARTFADELAHH